MQPYLVFRCLDIHQDEKKGLLTDTWEFPTNFLHSHGNVVKYCAKQDVWLKHHTQHTTAKELPL